MARRTTEQAGTTLFSSEPVCLFADGPMQGKRIAPPVDDFGGGSKVRVPVMQPIDILAPGKFQVPRYETVDYVCVMAWVTDGVFLLASDTEPDAWQRSPVCKEAGDLVQQRTNAKLGKPLLDVFGPELDSFTDALAKRSKPGTRTPRVVNPRATAKPRPGREGRSQAPVGMRETWPTPPPAPVREPAPLRTKRRLQLGGDDDE